MDWTLKALLTTLIVAGVLALARRAGPGRAGLLAGLPTITAPTLALLAHDCGPAFAAEVAVSGTAVCALLAAFALAYTRAPRRGGVTVALLCGTLGAAALAWPALWASRDLGMALALAVAGSGAALACMPRATAVRRLGPARGDALVSTAAAAGTVSAAAAVVGPLLGVFAAGLLSSLPVISGAVALSEHVTNGPDASATFLRGYVEGLLGKAAFGAAFAVAAVPCGAVCALLLAIAGAAAVTTVLSLVSNLEIPVLARGPQPA